MAKRVKRKQAKKERERETQGEKKKRPERRIETAELASEQIRALSPSLSLFLCLLIMCHFCHFATFTRTLFIVSASVEAVTSVFGRLFEQQERLHLQQFYGLHNGYIEHEDGEREEGGGGGGRGRERKKARDGFKRARREANKSEKEKKKREDEVTGCKFVVRTIFSHSTRRRI